LIVPPDEVDDISDIIENITNQSKQL
jgi:hypothetical protein